MKYEKILNAVNYYIYKIKVERGLIELTEDRTEMGNLTLRSEADIYRECLRTDFSMLKNKMKKYIKNRIEKKTRFIDILNSSLSEIEKNERIPLYKKMNWIKEISGNNEMMRYYKEELKELKDLLKNTFKNNLVRREELNKQLQYLKYALKKVI